MIRMMLMITLFLNGIIFFQACKKDQETVEVDYDTHTSSDNTLAEGTFNDILNIAIEAIDSGSVSTYRIGSAANNQMLSTCASVTTTPNGSGTGGTIVVDFGTSNCYCSDFRYRRGIINITYTGPYRTAGTIITTSFTDYYVGRDSTNMYKVSGTKSVTNNGLNSFNHMSYTITVDGHLVNKNSEHMDWFSTRTREWIGGENTPIWNDDEYIITGSASGTNFEGNSFAVSITEAIHVKLNCKWITQGKFELTPTGKAARILDYGNGTCDDAASLSVNGKTIAITLR